MRRSFQTLRRIASRLVVIRAWTKKGDFHDFQDGTASDLEIQERDPETRIDMVNNNFSI